MSLVPSFKKIKQSKISDWTAYHKEYRENNLDHLRNLDRFLRYYIYF